MRTNPISLNPFSLMMEPDIILKAMERSQTLRGLRRHQMRPLDKPLIPLSKTPGVWNDAALEQDAIDTQNGELED